MSYRSRLTAVAAAAAITSALAISGPAAQAATSSKPTIKAPVGASTSSTTMVRLSENRTVQARMVVGATKRITAGQARQAGVADATAATSCWRTSGSITYGPSWAWLFRFTNAVAWCGNGSTMGAPSHQVYGQITTLGRIDQWQYDGIIGGPSNTKYYDGWAYQTFVQGKFQQCILRVGCTQIAAHPIIWWNLYANGNRNFYWQG